MTIARLHIVDAHSPGAYHVTSRCVRRAWLCGSDPLTGKDFSHRRNWIEKRIFALADCFSIAIYAYAIMSNHVHLVVRTDPSLPQQWDASEVARRWLNASRRSPECDTAKEQRITAIADNELLVEKYRKRLGSLSSFMQLLNESIARMANVEDECKGRFWEGRFRCQALLDEPALLSAMAYVDLNPVRANIVDTPEAAEYVSIRRRFHRIGEATADMLLLPIAGTGPECAVSEKEYLVLVDETGRMLRNGKRGSMNRFLPPILSRLKMSERAWLKQVRGTASCYWRVIGTCESFAEKAAALGLRWLKGHGFARDLRIA